MTALSEKLKPSLQIFATGALVSIVAAVLDHNPEMQENIANGLNLITQNYNIAKQIPEYTSTVCDYAGLSFLVIAPLTAAASVVDVGLSKVKQYFKGE